MIRVQIHDLAGTFAENKDIAAEIRESSVRPALEVGEKVVIDFTDVEGATQSFVHALVADLIRTRGAEVLTRIDFHACNKTVRSIVAIVAEYSQLDLT